MKFIGATNWFIRWPFLVEGIIIGIIALFDLIVALASTDKEFNERYKVEGENLTDYLLELAKLKMLKDDGTISEDEFEAKKKMIMLKYKLN